MAKILTFRNNDKGAAPNNFLTDDAEKLSFRTAEDGAVSLGDMPDLRPRPVPNKDWTNQELADLFRVRQLLSGANVVVETTRGVTDEGDPWFIFCHHNGDVFIHMARIDGLYLLDSPNVCRPLRGRDFNALIADYTNHALPAATHGNAETAHRVIRLERGGTVRLHPSAMLAALIWTLFLAAEDLVLLAPEEQTADSNDLLGFSAAISADFSFDSIEMETADPANLGVVEAMKSIDTDVLHGTPEAQVQFQVRDAMGQQGLAMHQNAFAMGLSTIAIAMGFMSDTVLLDDQHKVLEGLNKIGFNQYTADVTGPEIDQINIQGGDALIDMLADFLGLDLSLNTHVADAPVANGDAALLQQKILHATQATDTTDIPVVVKKTVQTALRDDNELAETAHVHAAYSHGLQNVVASARAEDEAFEEGTTELFESLYDQLEMEEFQLGETTVQASFALTPEDFFMVGQFVLTDPTAVSSTTTSQNQRTTDHRVFDDRAQSFIDYIQSKDTEVGVITIGNELIMIDRAALLESGANTYSFSWETTEGQVISLIGLRAEFQEFDLIA